jgi:hypothetical protein
VNAITAPSSGQAPTPAAASESTTAWIANTDGGGVYLRNSPHDGDRAGVLPEGSQVTITGEQVEGDGRQWYPVATTDNQQGYVPILYLSRTKPEATPAPSSGEPK